MKRRTVFISSVFYQDASCTKSFLEVRKEVEKILTELGFEVYLAENDQNLEKGTLPTEVTLPLCLKKIDECDIYLGIYPSRYGSDDLGIGNTDAEYQHAIGKRKPRFLYQYLDRVEQSAEEFRKQRGFVRKLYDPRVSSIRPSWLGSSLNSLYEAIERDFKKIRLGHLALPMFGTALTPWMRFKPTRKPSPAIWAERRKELQDARKISLDLANEVGRVHLSESESECDLSNSPIDKVYIKGLFDYLEDWIYPAAWTTVTGPFGQANISMVRIGLAQILGFDTFRNDSSFYGMASSSFYALGDIAQAYEYYLIFSRKDYYPGMLGPILLSLKDYNGACKCFKDILDGDIGDDSRALHSAYLGIACALNGD